MRRRLPGGARPLGALAALLALLLYLTAPLLGCLDECFVDLGALHGEQTGRFELADVRLHAWILSWVQHALASDPSSLFDTNAFHPAPKTLTGSEHTLGIAALMLPFRLLTTDAVGLYQLALVLSFALLAATTFALVHWLSGSSFASLVAASVAMVMPWRLSELAHIQLLQVQWFPLVWLLIGRILSEEGQRRDAWLLAVALAFQLLTSFYLSYYLLLSAAILVVVLLALGRAPRRGLQRLVAAFAPALLLLAASAIPYLARQVAADLAPQVQPIESIGFANAWRAIAPPFRFGFHADATRAYAVPIVVLVLAAATLPVALRRAAGASGRRVRGFCLAMWGAALAAFVMMIGRHVSIGGVEIPLPGRLAAALVPGFGMLRAPFRWGLLIGLAAPVLCGLGIVALERSFAPALSPVRRAIAAAAIAALLAANVGIRSIPARPAWASDDPIRSAHEALRELPDGPALDVPWPMGTLAAQQRESRTLLASALHWRPILNGYTGYPPGTYHFLRRVAQALPDRDAVQKLRALAGLRFVVVYTDVLGAERRAAWEAAREAGDLSLARASPRWRIYEVAERGDGGKWTAALLSAQPRPQTLAGLSREPLVLPADAGRLEARLRSALHTMLWPRAQFPLELAIHNATDRPWPGFDAQSDGMVRLRYAFLAESGELELESTASLDADVLPRAVTTCTAFIAGPKAPGSYRLRLDLVQRVGGELRPLPVPAVERRVVVEPASRVRPEAVKTNTGG